MFSDIFCHGPFSFSRRPQLKIIRTQDPSPEKPVANRPEFLRVKRRLGMSMKATTYRIIQPPFTLQFDQMPKNELKAYSSWFQSILPERIQELASAVQSTSGFEEWKPDFSADSLSALGDWFATQIETRPRTQEEIDRWQTPYPIEISATELTNRTFSLAMDIGMYLGQVLLRNHPALKWHQNLTAKRNIDYGQPVLVPFHNGKVPFNPVRVVVTLSYGLRDGRRTGNRLREIYDSCVGAIG
jgi:hypothetical protein